MAHIIEANLDRADHQRAVLEMIDAYARDPMGDGRPLADAVRSNLITGLRELPTTLVFLAYKSELPVGIAVCFRGFSTFAARPLLNIHDLSVVPSQRGQGTGRQLLEAIAQKGRELGCCKITLEVQAGNQRARQVYHEAGFSQTLSDSPAGGSLFYSKPL